MASEFLRIGGKDQDDLARPLKVDGFGHVWSTPANAKLTNKVVINNGFVLTSGQSSQIVVAREMRDNVTAWALHLIEINRPSTEHSTSGIVTATIEYATDSTGFSNEIGGLDVFNQKVVFSNIEEFDKGLAIPCDNDETHGTNLILSGRYFNIPMAKFLRVTLTNNHPSASVRFLPPVIIEEGNFR